MEDRKANTLSNALIEKFKEIPLGKRKTFTSDNGKEFARFKDYEEVLGCLIILQTLIIHGKEVLMSRLMEY